jgi:hypothetical protein
MYSMPYRFEYALSQVRLFRPWLRLQIEEGKIDLTLCGMVAALVAVVLICFQASLFFHKTFQGESVQLVRLVMAPT